MPSNKELLKLIKQLSSDVKRLRNEVQHLRNNAKKSRKGSKKSKVETLNKLRPVLAHKKSQEIKENCYKELTSSETSRSETILSTLESLKTVVPEKDVVSELRRRKKKRQRNRRRNSRKKKVSQLIKCGSDPLSAKMQCASACTQRRLELRMKMNLALCTKNLSYSLLLFKNYDHALQFAIGMNKQRKDVSIVEFVTNHKSDFDEMERKRTPLK